MITANIFGADYRTIHGPISIGSQVTDTIRSLKISVFNITDKNYTLNSALKKVGYQTDHDILVDANDELYREIVLSY